MRTRFSWLAAVALPLVFSGCADQDSPLSPSATGTDLASDEQVAPVLAEADRLAKIAAEPDGGVATWIEQARLLRGSVVHVPAGSVDALAAAIAAAGTNGTVILEAGMHTESETVTITTRVQLVGEIGAILQVTTTPFFDTFLVDPGIHVRDVSKVLIWGIDLRTPGGSGNTGILLENAPQTTVGKNSITQYQTGMILQHADRSFLHGNTIAGAADGFFGIEVVNGDRVSIVSNEVSGAPAFGIWACDRKGTLLFNNVHDNTIGIIFCKVPFGGETLPDGEAIGSDESGTDWVAAWNVATNNQWGYLAIDGATACQLVFNDASSNAAYDVELAGDSFRFGFLTPTSSNCTAIISDPAIVVKNCGLDNTVVGGTQVDTNVDPCF
jgi:hypothetical protein